MAASEEDRLPEEELIGQMSYVFHPCILLPSIVGLKEAYARLGYRTFILAAMDTTSNALAITLQLLSEHQDIQEKLRREILAASQGNDLDHDALVSLPYLDAVCRETLRLCVLLRAA